MAQSRVVGLVRPSRLGVKKWRTPSSAPGLGQGWPWEDHLRRLEMPRANMRVYSTMVEACRDTEEAFRLFQVVK